MKKAQQGSSSVLTSSTTSVKQRGYYDVLLQTSAKYPSNIAMRMYDEGRYTSYTYSEMFGVCEYIAQNLQQLKCNRGIIGLVSRRNIIVPCAIAAAHKCCTSFMFLDPTGDMSQITNDIEFTVVMSILLDPQQSISQELCKTPDRIITVFNYTISFYNYGPPTDEMYKKMVKHSFIARTSGTTGLPKNIQVPIECIQPNIDDLTSLFQISTNDVIFFSTPLTFDPSMVEILLACTNGASLLLAPDQAEALFPDKTEHSVTVWQTTPSKFFQYSNADLKNRILSANSTLKVLALGGEPFNGLKRLKQLKDAKNKTKIFTLYGVTEMSCWACAAQLDLDKYSTDREIPLGQALSETQIIVEPQAEEPSTGKIILVSNTRNCIILNRNKDGGNEQNSLKFIDTGDLAEVHNGTVYYRGRTDDQIKRFGHKINLLFIESVVNQCPKVKACSCVWLPKPRLLIVYFSSETISSRELSDFLKCKLDDKHWPDKIVRINNLPTSPHGKVSKLVLSKLYEKLPPTVDSLKLKLLHELKGLLNANFTYDEIKNKNFFAIGGTSFRAVTLCNKIALNDPQFGKFLLPHLIGQKNTIDQIMTLAEQTLCTDDVMTELPPSSDIFKSRRRSKRSASITDSENSVTGMSKKPAISLARTDMEFVLLWTHNTGKCVDASPTLWESNLTLYVTVGSHSGKVVVLDALYGELCGTVDMKSRVEASVYCYQDVLTGTPCGVVGAHDGTIVSYRLDTCEVKWRINIGSMVKSKATSCKGHFYVAAYDGYVRCIDILSGRVTQMIQIAEQGISADLVLAKDQFILTGTLSGVCASVDTETNTVVWRGALTAPVFANPVLYDHDKYVVFAEVSGELHCRTVEKGIKIWKYSCTKANIFSSIYIKEVENMRWQMTFGCHDKNVYCISVKHFQPSLNWKCPLSSPVYSTPVGINNKFILAASNNGKLNIIDMEHGTFLMNYELPGETFSSPAVHEDYIYIGCRNDHLYALRFVQNV